jgi:pSer/pThr/pTyr-binding forkhead associated (FHA) protein
MPTIRLTILDPLLAREFDVPMGVTLIGRESSTNLPIQNPLVSRRHAQLISDGQICELIDLGSANGTFIDDERLLPNAPRTLEDGMRLRFGPIEVAVQVLPDAPVDEPIDQPPTDAPLINHPPTTVPPSP